MYSPEKDLRNSNWMSRHWWLMSLVAITCLSITGCFSSAKNSVSNPGSQKNMLDPKSFSEVQLSWSISGAYPPAGAMAKLRESVTEILAKRDVTVVSSSSKKMNVVVKPGPGRETDVEVSRFGFGSGVVDNFTINLPTYSIDISYTDGSKVLWSYSLAAKNFHPISPNLFLDPDDPKGNMLRDARSEAWNEIAGKVRSATPFPLSQRELDAIAQRKLDAEVLRKEREEADEIRRKEKEEADEIRRIAKEKQKAIDDKAARSGVAKNVPWSVPLAPWKSDVESTTENIQLDFSVSEAAEVRYTSADNGRLFVLSDPSQVDSSTFFQHVDIYDAAAAKKVAELSFEPSLFGGLLKDGSSVVIARDNVVEIQSLSSGAIVNEWMLDDIDTIRWISVAGDQVFVRTNTNELSSWDSKTGKRLYVIENIAHAALDPSGKYLAVAEANGSRRGFHIYSAVGGDVLGNLKRNTVNYDEEDQSRFVFSYDGTKLLFRNKKSLLGWDLKSGRRLPKCRQCCGFSFEFDDF